MASNIRFYALKIFVEDLQLTSSSIYCLEIPENPRNVHIQSCWNQCCREFLTYRKKKRHKLADIWEATAKDRNIYETYIFLKQKKNKKTGYETQNEETQMTWRLAQQLHDKPITLAQMGWVGRKRARNWNNNTKCAQKRKRNKNTTTKNLKATTVTAEIIASQR